MQVEHAQLNIANPLFLPSNVEGDADVDVVDASNGCGIGQQFEWLVFLINHFGEHEGFAASCKVPVSCTFQTLPLSRTWVKDTLSCRTVIGELLCPLG